METKDQFLESSISLFRYYKSLGEKVFDQLHDRELFWQSNPETNSIATIVKHLWGNMLSRWTDFLASDGEKEWRERDAEFLNDLSTRKEVMEKWEAGWSCLFEALEATKEVELSHIVYIRNEGHTVLEAIQRQLAHYASHIGQIMHIGKTLKGKDWKSLSIPRGESDTFNSQKFSGKKHRAHFTNSLVDPGDGVTEEE